MALAIGLKPVNNQKCQFSEFFVLNSFILFISGSVFRQFLPNFTDNSLLLTIHNLPQKTFPDYATIVGF